MSQTAAAASLAPPGQGSSRALHVELPSQQKSKKSKAVETTVKSEAVEDPAKPSQANTELVATGTKSGEKRSIAFCKGTVASESMPSSSDKCDGNAIVAPKRPLTSSKEKSEAYKSIFTSHSSAKRSKEESSNWITHTAYYF